MNREFLKAFFYFILIASSNSFVRISFGYTKSLAKLDTVLQDLISVIHTLCIYAGYVASAIGFCLCLSKIINIKLYIWKICIFLLTFLVNPKKAEVRKWLVHTQLLLPIVECHLGHWQHDTCRQVTLVDISETKYSLLWPDSVNTSPTIR